MTPQTKTYITFGSIIAILIAIIVVVVIFKDAKIAELELQNGAFDVKIEELEKDFKVLDELDKLHLEEIGVLEDRYDSLLTVYNQTPTDSDVKITNNIVLIKPNGSWDAIKRTIDEAVTDTLGW